MCLFTLLILATLLEQEHASMSAEIINIKKTLICHFRGHETLKQLTIYQNLDFFERLNERLVSDFSGAHLSRHSISRFSHQSQMSATFNAIICALVDGHSYHIFYRRRK